MKAKLRFLTPLGVLLVLIVGAAIVAQPIAAAAASKLEREQSCGSRGNNVQASFPIPAANRIWDYFPALLETPELAVDTRPAYVVVFRGNYHPWWKPSVPGSQGQDYHDAICVIQEDGTPNLYVDVSRDGMTLP